MFRWPLAIQNFTFLDRLKICGFFLNKNNRWTQDRRVREYEEVVAKYVHSRYAVFVSSGSAANQLICQQIKDKLIEKGEWPRRSKVIVSAVTWQTNVSVWVREGFEPIFVDVNLEDFCLDYESVEEIIRNGPDDIACIFPTSVLGFTPNLGKLTNWWPSWDNEMEVRLDNCENFFGEFDSEGEDFGINVNSYFTSSASCFVAHHITTGTEGGFIFTDSREEYEYFLLSRAHGSRRNLFPYGEKWENQPNNLVNPQFDFQTLSSNYRATDIQAFMGLLDFKRADEYKKHRNKIYNLFAARLNSEKFYLPKQRIGVEDCAFCLPIICKQNQIEKVKEFLKEKNIEFRGFISGNMLRQKPYQKYGDYLKYKNAEFLNNHAVYIGLHTQVSEKMVGQLTQNLNKIS